MIIRITKKNVFHINHRNNKKVVKNTDISYYLNKSIEIGKGVTFERIFNIIIENKSLFNIIFSGHMGGYSINEYVDDYHNINKKTTDDYDIKYCEVHRVFEHFKFKDGSENNELYLGFHGVGFEPENIPYSFMFTPINQLKTIPIKVNNLVSFVIDTGLNLGNKDVKLEDKYKKIHKGDLPITVFEFFGAILYEISWMGTPKERESKSKKLEETVKRIESGEEETYPMEWDENDMPYLIIDGKRDYLFGKKD